MKHFLTILLFIAVLAQTFNRSFIVLDYELNKEYIARNLCENRYRPQMHCNGKCLLMKKMKQEEKKDQQNPERKGENKFESISFQLQPAVEATTYYMLAVIDYPSFEQAVVNNYTSDCFHPPQA